MSLIEFQLIAGGYTMLVFLLGMIAGITFERHIK